MDQQCHFTQHLPSTSKLFWAPKFRLNWHRERRGFVPITDVLFTFLPAHTSLGLI